ncbi:MAG: hypothetical protein WC145_12660 [Aliarcobacter sp.]|jgi:hypothetical protein|nr:hypothetical protein [Clostridia bacterium]
MNEIQKILTSIATMDANIVAMSEKIDLIRTDIRNHDDQIRALDRRQATLIGKLTAAWVISAAVVSAILGAILPWR